MYESQPEIFQNKDGFNIQVDEKTFFSGKNYALLDYSLDAIELKRAYEKEFRRQKGFINKLYGNTLVTSISKLERYRSCPFSYYLQSSFGRKPAPV